jgi:chorismate-pyruvate lyase
MTTHQLGSGKPAVESDGGWRAGLVRPGLITEPMPADELPEPYRALLAHTRDMTPTLEEHHRQPLRLHVLERHEEPGWLFREVVLVGAHDGRAVEYGAIRIHLDALPEASAAEVLACRQPLGATLRDHAVPHASRPSGFFRVKADARICDALRLTPPCTLYGRRNRIESPDGAALAEILEILPPAQQAES